MRPEMKDNKEKLVCKSRSEDEAIVALCDSGGNKIRVKVLILGKDL